MALNPQSTAATILIIKELLALIIRTIDTLKKQKAQLEATLEELDTKRLVSDNAHNAAAEALEDATEIKTDP